MSLKKLNAELVTLQEKLEDRQSGITILQDRLKPIQHAYDHFDNCDHDSDEGNYHADFAASLEEQNHEFCEQLREHFSTDYATIFRQFDSQYGSDYNDHVSNMSHDNFEEYKRLAEVIEAIEDRISERETQESELEDQVWDKEQEIEDFETDAV
ncbi:hypothetical protein COPG_00003 [Colwellia phage 9A]|uniref:Uncharacterized protein n=1 Tax=Colwellia phage 9A TaxID=765765 RepID=I3UM84_9CAUD|nr:hypothetical protein COPG_00003 [Colwellia phage 9A]AFK66599.1 hypothetical protein COPG_00003 [Colwellia phage 9A]